MNLGVIEEALLLALRASLGNDIAWQRGPAFVGPATGVRAQVFVHATTFDDARGITNDYTHIARVPLARPGGLSGFAEQRPATIEVHVVCVCAVHAQAQELAGLVLPEALEVLATLGPMRLSDPSDARRRVHFADHRGALDRVCSERVADGGATAAQVTLTLRLTGFLHVELLARGGLQPLDPYAIPIALEIHADPAGVDLQREHVQLMNRGDAPLDLAGWTLQDAARRPHVYRFVPPRVLAPGAKLTLWTGRGRDDQDNVWWGRRRAVWNNTGDIAILRDPDGEERARASWSPPLPPKKNKKKKKSVPRR